MEVVILLTEEEEEIGLELLDGSIKVFPLLPVEEGEEVRFVGGARGGRWPSLKYNDI